MQTQNTYFRSLGLDELPQLVLFHNKIPMLMKGTDIRRPDETLDWIVKRQSGSSIMEVTDEILSDLGRFSVLLLDKF